MERLKLAVRKIDACIVMQNGATKEQLESIKEDILSVVDKPNVVKSQAVAVDALEHIAEYWNGDSNEKAVSDALWHIVETAESAIKIIKATE